MWEIRVITVGQAKDRGIREGLRRYEAMVSGEWRLRVEAVPASRRGDPPGRRREEGAVLRARLRPGREPVALDAAGEQMPSDRFAAMLSNLKDRGVGVDFLVGGPYGLDSETVGCCRRVLSLSPMTLSHELAALVLAEQVYRASAACSGRDYAK